MANSFLQDMEDIKYLPTLTKLMHLWREKAVAVHQKWCGKYGHDAAAHAARVPPKCISSRWGYITRCEKYVLEGDFVQLCAVFEDLFDEMSAKADKRKTKYQKRDDPTEVSAEMSEIYQQQLSRWAADVKNALSGVHFFHVMVVMSKARAPLDHFHLFLQRK
eukprot:9152007-Pyramimonas_sp.AAC.2